jgi:hypothetical protein
MRTDFRTALFILHLSFTYRLKVVQWTNEFHSPNIKLENENEENIAIAFLAYFPYCEKRV